MERALAVAMWVSAALLLTGLVAWMAGATFGVGLIHAGLWVLIATPVTRVLVALLRFARMRDATFVVLTVIVLACLTFPLARYFGSLLR